MFYMVNKTWEWKHTRLRTFDLPPLSNLSTDRGDIRIRVVIIIIIRLDLET